MTEQVNKATGEAEAIVLRAKATAEGIEKVASVMQVQGHVANNAVALLLAEKYISAFGELAKSSTTLMLPGGHASLTSDPAQFVAQVRKITLSFPN